MTLRPATSAMIAVRIGIPMATKVPKVKRRMMTAAKSPTTSERWVEDLDSFCPT